jgi:hypothetical protein
LKPVNNGIGDREASKCCPVIGPNHRHPEVLIVIHLPDESGTPGVVFEGQLILIASLQNAKQSQIENLEDLCGMQFAVQKQPRTGSREEFDDTPSEVR